MMTGKVSFKPKKAYLSVSGRGFSSSFGGIPRKEFEECLKSKAKALYLLSKVGN
jgi:hypothetical protein